MENGGGKRRGRRDGWGDWGDWRGLLKRFGVKSAGGSGEYASSAVDRGAGREDGILIHGGSGSRIRSLREGIVQVRGILYHIRREEKNEIQHTLIKLKAAVYIQFTAAAERDHACATPTRRAPLRYQLLHDLAIPYGDYTWAHTV